MNTKIKGKIYRNFGITLINLTVTIVILIILAGITISTIIGDNGIIKNSKKAKEQTEISEEKEIIDRATVESMGINKKGELIENELQEQLDKITNSGKTEVTVTGDKFEILFKESSRYYEVDKDGNIIDQRKIVVDKSPGDITKDENGKDLKGDESEPYEIWCIEDLIDWSNNYKKYLNSYIKLCTSLNFKSKLSYANYQSKEYGDINQDGKTDILIKELQNGEGFISIQQFSGTFDGESNIIDNIYISKQTNAGFILMLNNAKFKNITIKGEICSQNNDAGIIAQGGNSEFENIISEVKIYGNIAAGMIGKCSGELKIKNCLNLESIESTATAGGLCGDQFRGEILNCINEGTIKASGRDSYGVGGMCGNNSADIKIKNCINIGNIIYDGNKNSWYFGGTGGIIGLKRYKQILSVQNCVNIGRIQSTSYAGSICGMDLTYWEYKETYELINSFSLNNEIKVTGSNDVETGIIAFKREELNRVVSELNQYINDNKLVEEDWKLWKIGEKGYPVLE